MPSPKSQLAVSGLPAELVVCKNSDEPKLPDFARVAPRHPLEAFVILDGPAVGGPHREVCSTGPIVRQPNAKLTLPGPSARIVVAFGARTAGFGRMTG